MWTSKWGTTFQRIILLPSSTLKMEGVCSSEILKKPWEVQIYLSREDSHWYLYHHENLKSHLVPLLS
jgi:hypothetical protein